jgi:phosphoglycolate phosphatase-like HAD superfamily hydrolase
MKKREGFTNDHALIEAGIPESAIGPLCQSWLEAVEDDEWLALDELLEGAAEALKLVRDRGIELLIVTARRRPEGVHRTLTRLELKALIAHVCIVSPSSEVSAQKARHLWHYGAEIFFGDSESDYHSAQRADVAFAGVECGQRSAGFLSGLGATTFPTLRDAVADALQRNL